MWIKVTDNLPETYKLVLTYTKGNVFMCYLNKSLKWIIANDIGREIEVTHWQPLPEQPKDGE